MTYDGPIIDTHYHIWERKNIGWLQDPALPRMAGDYFGLRRDYPIAEWLHDISPEGVTKSVHVTANWGANKGLEETKWLQAIADQHGHPHGITFQADLTQSDIENQINAQTQYPNVRGVRQQLHWDSHPIRKAVSRPDLCNTEEFRRGFAFLEKYNLHFELQIFSAQAPFALELVKAFPHVKFLLLHSGMLTERTQLMIDQWRSALTSLASFPNVHIKLSGLGMFSLGVTQPQLRQVIRDSIQIFGVDRTI
jgi:predicted TIM-barrel fold metal-dependent hydrolase